MNKIEGTIVEASRLESGKHATYGIVIWTTAAQKDEFKQWESNGLVVVERKADHDARELGVEQLCEQMGQLRIDLAAREAEVERLRDVLRYLQARDKTREENMQFEIDEWAAKAGEEPIK